MMLRSQFARSVAAVAAVALTASLAACSGGPGDDSGPTTIRFSYLWTGTEAEAVQQIVEDFNASQDEIVVEGVSSPDSQQQLTSMSSSEGNFDISDNFGTSVGAWASRGILEPLDDHLERNGVATADFVPATLEQMRYDDQLYAMPITVHTYQLMYNKSILADAGIEPPTTMDELADAVKRLTVQEPDGTVTRLGLGSSNLEHTLVPLGFAFGGAWDTDGAPSPAEPGNVDALDWWRTNVVDAVGADAYASFTSGLGEYNSEADPFYTGKFAMVIDGEWRAISAPEVAPDLDWGVIVVDLLDDAEEVLARIRCGDCRHREPPEVVRNTVPPTTRIRLIACSPSRPSAAGAGAPNLTASPAPARRT